MGADTLMKAISVDKYFIDCHILFALWMVQLAGRIMLPMERVESLLRMWAEHIAPGFGIDDAEEFFMEAFADHPDRYDLFCPLAELEMRRGRMQRAEEIFGMCLVPVGGHDRKIDEVEQKYEAQADGYLENPLHVKEAAQFLRGIERCLADRTEMVIIDAACGAGALAHGLRPHAANLIGLELSARMAERGQALYDSMMVGDMLESLPRLKGRADMVVCSGSTYYFEDLSPFIQVGAAALKPGGLLIFSDYAAPEGMGVMVTCGGTMRYCRSPERVRESAGRSGLIERGSEIVGIFRIPARIWVFQNPAAAG